MRVIVKSKYIERFKMGMDIIGIIVALYIGRLLVIIIWAGTR